MWEPLHLTNLWAFTACYRDSLGFYFIVHCLTKNSLTDFLLGGDGGLVVGKDASAGLPQGLAGSGGGPPVLGSVGCSTG
jgi:hypothetical protein